MSRQFLARATGLEPATTGSTVALPFNHSATQLAFAYRLTLAGSLLSP
jgi:hypothetical protein